MNIPSITHKVAISSVIFLVLGAAGVRLHIFNFQIGLLLFSLAGLLSFICICASALFTRRVQSLRGRRQLSQASIIALPAIIFFGLSLYRGAGSPLIHDISTNTERPPQFIMAVQQRSPSDNRLEYTDRNRQIQQQAYPDINTIPTLLSVDAAQKKALDIAESIGWKVEYQERGHIEAIERSFWFGFTDDIVIRISETSSGSMVDIRSASRVGEGDLGVNARRIRQFTQLYLK
ncbi:DUF1499 domain-containing protein [Zhongshania sp. BJYM1]|uniref:DUF1499 domain-containing protein n=1 Tax=Zhongshania aquatica TaxID=2965069 RepID=UPI0022B4C61A|nr:DUF1499 domain-containing protein [Marortus sp. BJYM1]